VARDLLLQLHHGQVRFGLVVVEGHAGVVQQPQHLVLVGVEPGQQPGGGRAAGTPSPPVTGPRGRVGRLPVGEQPLGAGVQPVPRLVVDPRQAGGAGPVGHQLASTSSSAMPAAQPWPGSSVIASSSRSRYAPHSACVTS
jgi:hypothetical protein